MSSRSTGPLSRAIAEREAQRGLPPGAQPSAEEAAHPPRPSVEDGALQASRNDQNAARDPWAPRGRQQRKRRSRPDASVDGATPPDEAGRDLGPEADPESVGRKILLDQLTGRARSRSDLAAKLAQRNVPDDIATRLLDRFEEVGLVDDAAFAREWVAQRHTGRGLARRALAQELRRKGIDDDVAKEALEAVEDDDEVEVARTLVRRKLRSVRGLATDKATRRLVGMLARKGHSASVAFRVVKEELALEEADPDSGPSSRPDWGA